MYRREIQCRSNKSKQKPVHWQLWTMCISCYLYCNSWTRFTVFLFAYHAVIVWMYITRTIYSTVGISEKWGPLNEVPLETLRATTNLEAIHYCQRNCVCTIHCMMVCVVSFNWINYPYIYNVLHGEDMRICLRKMVAGRCQWWVKPHILESSFGGQIRFATHSGCKRIFTKVHTHARTHIHTQHTQNTTHHTPHTPHTHHNTHTQQTHNTHRTHTYIYTYIHIYIRVCVTLTM